jgi:hypothetical protein
LASLPAGVRPPASFLLITWEGTPRPPSQGVGKVISGGDQGGRDTPVMGG